MVMKNVVKAVKEICSKFPNIQALETGTIRSYDEKHESTRRISNNINGHLTSVDISPKSIKISKDICNNAENVTWVESDSLEYLSSLTDEKFHFVLLDSINKGKFIWKEFVLIAPRIVDGGVLIIDDAGLDKNGGFRDNVAPLAVKAHTTYKKLKSAKVKMNILDSPHGTQLRIDFSKDNIPKILGAIK